MKMITNISNVYYQNLSEFVHYWKDLCKDSKALQDVLFRLDFRNLIFALTDRLTEALKNKFLGDREINDLLRTIDWENLTEVKILESYIGKLDCQHLKGVRKQELIKQFQEIGEKLELSNYQKFLEKRLFEEISNDNRASNNNLSVLAKLLLHEAIFFHASISIRNMPNRSFSKNFADISLREKTKYLESDVNSFLSWKSMCETLCSNIIIGKSLKKCFSLNKIVPFEFSSKFTWEHSLNKTLHHIIDILSYIRENYNFLDIDSEIPGNQIILKTVLNMRNNTELIEEFEEKVLEGLIHEILVHHFDEKLETLRPKLNSFLGYVADLINEEGDYISRTLEIRVQDNRPRRDNETLKSIMKPSFRVVSRQISKALVTEEMHTATNKFLKQLLMHLLELKGEIPVYFFEFSSSDLFYTILNNKKVLEKVANYLKDIYNNILVDFDKIDMDWQNLWIKFVKKFLNLLLEQFNSGYDLSSRLPWNKLKQDDLQKLISCAINDLLPESQNWEVGFVVKGMSPQTSVWKVGNVEFFDPNIWHHGLDIILRNPEFQNQNICGARVSVRERTPHTAYMKAREILQETLNFMTFIHSTGRSFGFDASISFISLCRPRGKFTRGFGRYPPKRTFATVGKDKNEKILKSSSYIDDFLTICAEGLHSLTSLQQTLRLSISWYRRGRWNEPDPDKFINYWIALEQLINGDGFNEFYQKLPKLYVTWRKTTAGFVIIYTLKQILKFINEDKEFEFKIQNDPELNRWDEYDYVLLENLSKLTKYASNPEHRKYINRFISDYPPQRVKAIKENVKTKRIEVKFTLLLLYSLRNKIVHHALDSIRYLPLYIEKLSDILEYCLWAVLSETLRIPTNLQNIDDFIERFQRPYAV